MAYFNKFIPQNKAPKDVQRIGVYDSSGNRLFGVPLGNLAFPSNIGLKLYSFDVISDVHYQSETASGDFQSALTYADETEDIAFTCVCGDLTNNGTADELTAYNNAKKSAKKPVWDMGGNHDLRAGLMNTFQNYIGNPLYYSKTYGDDVFIFVGNVADWTTDVLSTEELQWLYQTLESNRNKRCFLFEHIRPTNGCGNALGLYKRTDIVDWGGTCGAIFESLLSHYKNLVFFHGHSHLKFYLQEYDELANYDNIRGSHSVHVPSLSIPRDDIDGDGTADVIYADSEGYVVDVYENGIHLKGRDFIKGEFLPIASYWLDTTLKTVESKPASYFGL